MMRTKLLAVILAACTMLTLAVSAASADGGGGGCKKDCPPPPPCKVDCPNPEPTEPPVTPSPPPAPDQVCYDQEALRIAERHHSPKFVDVAVTITGIDGEDFVVEYQRNRESSQARTLDGGELDGPYSGGFTVRAWRDIDALVRVRVWDAGCNNPIPNITLAIV